MLDTKMWTKVPLIMIAKLYYFGLLLFNLQILDIKIHSYNVAC